MAGGVEGAASERSNARKAELASLWEDTKYSAQCGQCAWRRPCHIASHVVVYRLAGRAGRGETSPQPARGCACLQARLLLLLPRRGCLACLRARPSSPP